MKKAQELARIQQRIKSEIETAEAALREFSSSLADNPAEAFVWSSGPMRAAAFKKTMSEVLASLEKGAEIEAVKERVLTMVLSKSRQIESSSSAPRNAIERCELATLSMIYTDILGGGK